MLADPHYQIRGFARWVEQQDLGWIAMEGPCFRASGMSDVAMKQAPRCPLGYSASCKSKGRVRR